MTNTTTRNRKRGAAYSVVIPEYPDSAIFIKTFRYATNFRGAMQCARLAIVYGYAFAEIRKNGESLMRLTNDR